MPCKAQPGEPAPPPCDATGPVAPPGTTITAIRPLTAQDLLTEQAFAGLVATVQDNNPGMAEELAKRIVTEGVSFIATCAANPGKRLAPSPVVDEGWHAAILHTKLYSELCLRLGGFVHHFPERPNNPTGFRPDVIEYTLDTMRASGYEPDVELWAGPAETTVTVGGKTWHTPMPGGCGPINPGNCATHGGGGDGE
ncbi:glycine-rich domain-containing protein [Streptomyces sp. NPDC056387]|uniref:glycine-rich domain-containing protein n=1 Tax=Streptomyces sp. NPDC056387 TaxID=3345803 RepID=UPI0035DC54DC